MFRWKIIYRSEQNRNIYYVPILVPIFIVPIRIADYYYYLKKMTTLVPESCFMNKHDLRNMIRHFFFRNNNKTGTGIEAVFNNKNRNGKRE